MLLLFPVVAEGFEPRQPTRCISTDRRATRPTGPRPTWSVCPSRAAQCRCYSARSRSPHPGARDTTIEEWQLDPIGVRRACRRCARVSRLHARRSRRRSPRGPDEAAVTAQPRPRSPRLRDPGASPQVCSGLIASVDALRRGLAGRRPSPHRQPRDFIGGALDADGSGVDPRERRAVLPAGCSCRAPASLSVNHSPTRSPELDLNPVRVSHQRIFLRCGAERLAGWRTN